MFRMFKRNKIEEEWQVGYLNWVLMSLTIIVKKKAIGIIENNHMFIEGGVIKESSQIIMSQETTIVLILMF